MFEILHNRKFNKKGTWLPTSPSFAGDKELRS